jgi:hydrophobe/amphiphile efflux-3 (HAE3) family protein
MTVSYTDRKYTRMQRFWSWLALNAGKHAGLVSLFGLLLTLVLGYGITRLEFATGQDSYLNTDDQVYIDNVEYQELFGGQAILVLFTMRDGQTITDLMDPANQESMDAIEAQLKSRPDLIEGVVTPKVALEWTDNLIQRRPDGQIAASPTDSAAGMALLHALEDDPSPEGQAARQADSIITLERLNAVPADQRVMENRAWIEFLLDDNQGEIRLAQRPVFPDRQHAQIVVRLIGNASIEVEGDGSLFVRDTITQAVEDGAFPNAELTVTGAPYFLKDINDYLKGGMLQLGAIAVVVMTIILVLLFHVRWRLLPLGVILIGVIWAFGLAGYLGIPLTLVTIAGLPVMLGIGIDYAIQMHARVEEEVIIDRDPHPIQETARGLGPALLVVTFDAVFAFAALRFAQVPMIRQFGLLLAVGIMVICFTSIVLPLAILGIREYKSPTKGRDFREGALGRMTMKLGSSPMWIAPVLVVASVAIFFGGLAVEDRLELQTDPIQWVDQSSQSIKDFRYVEEQTGSSSELAFFIETAPEDVFTQPTVDFVSEFAQDLLERYGSDIPPGKISPELLTATSLVTTVDYAIEVPGASPLNPRASDVEAAYSLAPEDIQNSTVNPERGAQNLIFRYGDRTLDERKDTVNQIRDSVQPPEGVRATASGLAIVGVGLLENLEANRILLTYLAIGFVGIFLAIRLKSVVRSLLSLVPVGIAVGAASIIAWVFDLKLSPMTAVGGPLIVAACTEFTSLILLRYLEERRRGLWPRQAVDVAAARTGRAFIVSALTAISGVLVIATSNLPLLRDFGLIVGMNVGVALLSALVVLPPMLVWADNRGWVSKGEVPDDVLQSTTPRLAGRAEPEGAPEDVPVG